MPIQYRVATREDAEALIRFLSEPRIDQCFKKPLSERSIGIRERVLAKLASGFWIAAFDGDAVCACVAVDVDQEVRSGFCSTLVVDPQYGGRVIAFAEICWAAVEHAVSAYGTTTFHGDSWAGNENFSKLMLGAGYRVVDEFEDPEKRPPGMKTVVYAIDLVNGGYDSIKRFGDFLHATFGAEPFARRATRVAS